MTRHNLMMGMRGDALTNHILWVAKDVFLEVGFERASMDEIASRAQTSKRTLYAHFENKEKLYLSVIDLVRGLFQRRIKTPHDYAEDPEEALVLFCGKYMEALLYERSVQMCRVSIAEAARFSEGASQYFNVLFSEVQEHLSAFLENALGLTATNAADAASTLLALILYPAFPKALFGMEPLTLNFDEEALSPQIDLKSIRNHVKLVLAAYASR